MLNASITEGYLKTADASVCHTKVIVMAMQHLLSSPLPQDPQYFQLLVKRLKVDLDKIIANITICDECLIATFESLKLVSGDLARIKLTKDYAKIANANRTLETEYHALKDTLAKYTVNSITLNKENKYANF